jgi:hypothetical protein
MEVTIQKIDEPKPANPERGFPEGKYYHVYTTGGQKLLLNKEKYNNFVQEKGLKQGATGTVVTGESNGYIYLNQFILTNQNVVNSTSSPQPTAGGHDVAELQGRDWAIILQACVNRDATLTADQKLKFILLNYSRGSSGAFKHLQQTEDLDNTALSQGDF